MNTNSEILLDIIKNRRSIRKFTDQAISDNTINLLIEAARWAPSAGNRQSLDIIIVRDRTIKKELSEAALNQESLVSAPLLFVMCANVPRTSSKYGERGERLYVIQDVAAATQNLLLLAHSLGLGTVWVGAFDDDKVSKILKLPGYVRPQVIIPVGYYEKHPNPRSKLNLEEIISYEYWGNKEK